MQDPNPTTYYSSTNNLYSRYSNKISIFSVLTLLRTARINQIIPDSRGPKKPINVNSLKKSLNAL